MGQDFAGCPPGVGVPLCLPKISKVPSSFSGGPLQADVVKAAHLGSGTHRLPEVTFSKKFQK